MQTDPQFVNELRAMFKAGTTPTALIRCIAERYPGESAIDRIVRAYFREAFGVPMLQIGREQVERIAEGGKLASLNSRVVHRMVATRGEWDKPTTPDELRSPCWLDSVTATDEAKLLRKVEVGTQPELAGCWEHIDEQGKRFISRTIASSQSLYETVQVLAALAEQLQQQLHAAEIAQTRTE